MAELNTSTLCRRIRHSFPLTIGNSVNGLHVLLHAVEASNADYRYVFMEAKVCECSMLCYRVKSPNWKPG